jgi:hypothetical protein
MDLIQINELRELISLQYPHICLNQSDLTQFLNIPWEAKEFYPMNKYRRQFYEKIGFFHNGKTTVWAVSNYGWAQSTHKISLNHIRIADKEIPTIPGGAYWSKDFSFEKAGDANRIMRMMKMKAFW